jgi:hypothetical protein
MEARRGKAKIVLKIILAVACGSVVEVEVKSDEGFVCGLSNLGGPFLLFILVWVTFVLQAIRYFPLHHTLSKLTHLSGPWTLQYPST